jgi:hypothetical protein
MNKKLIVAVGFTLSAGVAISGVACWQTLRNGRFTDSPCQGGGFSATVAFLPQYDSVELRETSGDQSFRVLQAAGTACARASDKPGCEAKVAAASSQRGWSNGSHGRMPGHTYFVATKGDEVVVIDGDKLALGTALAPIDSVAKAALLASMERNIGVSCEPSVRAAGGGYEVHLVSDSCFGPADEVIHVNADGSLDVISAERGKQTCVGSRSLLSPSPRERGEGRGEGPSAS